MRAHYRGVVTDSAGDLLAGTVITVLVNGTSNPVTLNIYADGTSGTLLPNPFTSPDGNINFYMDSPQRVDLQLAPPGQSPVTIPDIDIGIAGVTSVTLTFPGAGP